MPLASHVFRDPKGPLPNADLDLVHDGTMQILSQVGVVFASDQALGILERGGCQVDSASGRVYFPEPLVQECIEQCPSQFTIRARNRDYDLEVGGDRLYFQSHPGLHLLDLESNVRREATFEDVGPLVRLVDAMDEIHLAIVPTTTISNLPLPIMIEMGHSRADAQHAKGHGRRCLWWMCSLGDRDGRGHQSAGLRPDQLDLTADLSRGSDRGRPGLCPSRSPRLHPCPVPPLGPTAR